MNERQKSVKEITDRHDNNMTETINDIKPEQARRINEAEKGKELPKEALILSNTETVVFFGNPLERARFKKKWMKAAGQRLPGAHNYNLKKLGKCITLSSIPNEDAEIWHIFETADIHMTSIAQQRLEENASAKAIQENTDQRKQVLLESND